MIGYAIYRKGSPGPVGVITYDQPLDQDLLNGLVEYLCETYRTEVTVRLMNQAELDLSALLNLNDEPSLKTSA